MPLVRIEVREGWSAAEKRGLFDAVRGSLVETLGIPDADRTQRLFELAREDFELPPDRSDRYVLIEITLFPGRSLDAKRRLYQRLVQRLGDLGIAPSDILIVLHEPTMENWGIRGGHPASEVDVRFQVRV